MGIRHRVVTSTEVALIYETLYELGWRVMFSPKRLTVLGDTTLTQLPLSKIIFLTCFSILMKVWKMVVRSQYSSLTWVRMHQITPKGFSRLHSLYCASYSSSQL